MSSRKALEMKQLVTHLSSKHGVNDVFYKCGKCGKTETLCRQIGAHLRYCVGKVTVPVRNFKCEHCEMSFDTKSGHGVHFQKAHKVEYNMSLPTKGVFAWEDGEIEAMARLKWRSKDPRLHM